VCHSNQDAPAQQPDTYPPDRPDPIIVDGIFYKKADGQNKNGDPYLADQVLTDKFFPIRMTFKKAGRRSRRLS
jgi:hypothetical protein